MNYNTSLPLNLLKENFENDNETVVAILEVFLTEVSEDMITFKNQIDQGDLAGISATAHKIKSNYRLLELEIETVLLQEIETLAKNDGSIEDVKQLFAQFQMNYQDGIEQVILTKKELTP